MNKAFYVLGVVLAAACDVTSTVGYNEGSSAATGVDGGSASGAGVLACGADSDLAQCSAGTTSCVVRELFNGERGTLSLAVDDDAYYFMSEREVIGRRPRAGGASVPLATTKQISSFVIDATHVYWTEYSAYVGRVPKTGGPAETVMTPFGHPTELVTDADHVYCVLPEEGEVAMTTKPGGPIAKAIGQAVPSGLALDGTHVYWVNRGTAANTGQLVRAPQGDLTRPEIVAADLDAPIRVAIDGADAIVVEAGGTVRRLPKTGGAATVLTTGLLEPKAVGAFGGRVYVAGMSGLVALQAGGGAPAVLEARPVSGFTLGCEGALGILWHFEGQVVRYGK